MIPWFQYTTVHIGPVPIQVWGSFVALGMGVALYILHRVAKKRGENAELLLDFAFWIILGGIFGARIGHILFYELSHFIAHPGDLVKIWHGGMSSFGGLFGAFLAFFIFAKKKQLNKEQLWKYADLLAFSSVFGWIIGRIGCFMIHDHLGKPCNCFLAIDTPVGPRLEMSLLEMLALLPLALYMVVTRNKKREQGWYLSAVLIYYGILRFILDFYRATDLPGSDVRYLGLTPGQYFAITTASLGLLTIKRTAYGKKKRI